MWFEILNILEKYYPPIGGFASLVIIVSIISIKSYQFYSRTKSVNNVFELRTKKVDNTFKEISERLNKLSKGLEMTNTILLEKKFIDNSCYSESHSPVQMSLLGKELYQQSGAKELMEELSEKLLAELESDFQQDTALEVQRNSLRILLEKMDEREFRSLQKFAYNNPVFNDNPLTYSNILFVTSLELRNRYLERHPDVNGRVD
jgi:hypothetical protein